MLKTRGTGQSLGMTARDLGALAWDTLSTSNLYLFLNCSSNEVAIIMCAFRK
jgi:hypothetical protein